MSEQSRGPRALYVISVAAELAGVHPQTLRMYERKGLIRPSRTSGNTRRYSQRDIDVLREIQRLTQEEGLNLAGAAMVIELRRRAEEAEERAAQLEARLDAMRRELEETVAAVHRSYRRDLVPYSPPAQLVRRQVT